MNTTVTWSGACAGGLAEGTGELKRVWGSDREHSYTATGQLQRGKLHGHWVVRFASGNVQEGPIVDGKRHGQWVERPSNDTFTLTNESPYVDGKKHGHWVESGFFTSSKGPYVDGKKHGKWVERNDIKDSVSEGPYVDGELHGKWVVRNADGTWYELTFVDGKRQD